MNLRNVFLRDILDAPEDDAPRLVYADWLEEHGDSVQAGFIRTQVRLAQLPPEAPRRAALAAREVEASFWEGWDSWG